MEISSEAGFSTLFESEAVFAFPPLALAILAFHSFLHFLSSQPVHIKGKGEDSLEYFLINLCLLFE